MRTLRTLAFATALAATSITACAQTDADADVERDLPDYVYVTMTTSKGDIVLELNHKDAPVTVENFVRYIEEEHYNGTVFHRVMSNFMIQGGGFTTEGVKKEANDRIENEWRNGLSNTKGTIAMARLGGQPDSATNQFFINVKDNPFLDSPRDGAGYAVFGEVIEGMDVVDAIKAVETGVKNTPSGQMKDWPTEDVVIEKVTRFENKANQLMMAERNAERERIAAEQEREAKERWDKALEEAKAFVKTLEYDPSKGAIDEATGMWILKVANGEGESPSETDVVKVHYTGWLPSGTKFDSSRDRGEPAEFPLNRVIPGWTKGVSMMKPGDRWLFLIPSDMAYGKQEKRGPGGRIIIPSNAALLFDVELIEVE